MRAIRLYHQQEQQQAQAKGGIRPISAIQSESPSSSNCSSEKVWPPPNKNSRLRHPSKISKRNAKHSLKGKQGEQCDLEAAWTFLLRTTMMKVPQSRPSWGVYPRRKHPLRPRQQLRRTSSKAHLPQQQIPSLLFRLSHRYHAKHSY